jgi:hypothetical protein
MSVSMRAKHDSIAKKDLVVAGLPINLYAATKHSWTDGHGPVAVMFFLHGRNGSAKSEAIESIVKYTIKQVEENRENDKSALDLIIVTFVSGLQLRGEIYLTTNLCRIREIMEKGSLIVSQMAHGKKIITKDTRKLWALTVTSYN